MNRELEFESHQKKKKKKKDKNKEEKEKEKSQLVYLGLMTKNNYHKTDVKRIISYLYN